MNRYFVSMYTDGPATRWNVIDRRTQEWVRRFPTEQKAREYAAALDKDARIEMLVERCRQQAARIEALEASLRDCVQYHVQAAADCRAISAVNQDNPLAGDALTAAIDHDIAAEHMAEIARTALDKDASK